MDVQIPQEQQAIVEGLVATGRFSSVQEAICEGIRLLAFNEELRQEIQIGIEQADRGELFDHDTVFAQLKAMATEGAYKSPMTKPFYTTAAKQDLTDILTYIARDKPNAAVAWVEKIEAKCLLIASQPEMGELKPQLGVDVRTNVVGRYVIFHRRANDHVEILRVIPGDRAITNL